MTQQMTALKVALMMFSLPLVVACFPVEDSVSLERGNSASAGAAMGKTTEFGDLIRSDIENAIDDHQAGRSAAKALYHPNLTAARTVSLPSSEAVSVQIDVCSQGEVPLELSVWFNTPEGSNTAQLRATQDCTYINKTETVIKKGSTIAYVGSAENSSDSLLKTTGTYTAEYNFELASVSGSLIGGARDLVLTGTHETELTLVPSLSIDGTATNSAQGEVYAPSLGVWLSLSTSENITSHYSISADPYFYRSQGEHALEDNNGNSLSILYRINENTSMQYIDYSLNDSINWTVSYEY